MDDQLPPLPTAEPTQQTQSPNVSVVNKSEGININNVGKKTAKVVGIILVVLLIFALLIWLGSFLFNKVVKSSQTQNQENSISSTASTQQRQADVNTIAQAIKAYYDTNHQLPPQITNSNQQIQTGGLDLCSILLPKYLTLFPVDPEIYNGQPLNTCQYHYQTGYDVELISSGVSKSIVVSAPMEQGKSISTTVSLTP